MARGVRAHFCCTVKLHTIIIILANVMDRKHFIPIGFYSQTAHVHAEMSKMGSTRAPFHRLNSFWYFFHVREMSRLLRLSGFRFAGP